MNEVENYVEKIIANLPLAKTELIDMKEELINHLEEHISDLIAEGYTESEAVTYALKAFGDEKLLHSEIKHTIFPFFRTFRFL